MPKRLSIAIVFLLILTVCLVWVQKLNEARCFAMIADRVAIVSTVLREHVKSRGAFPASLDILADDSNLDRRLIQPMAGESIDYMLPNEMSKASTPVIVVTFRSKRLIVFKDF